MKSLIVKAGTGLLLTSVLSIVPVLAKTAKPAHKAAITGIAAKAKHHRRHRHHGRRHHHHKASHAKKG